jgi:NADH-quinone oxidoreductase subunit N
MTTSHLIALLPLIILAAASVLLMLVVAIKRNHRLVFAVSLAGIAAAFASLWPLARMGTRTIGSLLVIDSFSLLYMGLLLPTAAVVVLFAYDYRER